MNDAPRTYLIIGLGNPGRKYKRNRHNIGFMLVDRLAERLGVRLSRLKQGALVTKARYRARSVILAKPQAFMNNSGRVVNQLVRFYKLPLSNLLVAYDDVDLPFETIRLRPSGGSAGHKGMRSIIQQVGTQEIPRLRLGVDRPPGKMDTPDYVLQDFPEADQEVLSIFLDRAADAVLTVIVDGFEQAMSEYNRAEQER